MTEDTHDRDLELELAREERREELLRLLQNAEHPTLRKVRGVLKSAEPPKNWAELASRVGQTEPWIRMLIKRERARQSEKPEANRRGLWTCIAPTINISALWMERPDNYECKCAECHRWLSPPKSNATSAGISSRRLKRFASPRRCRVLATGRIVAFATTYKN